MPWNFTIKTAKHSTESSLMSNNTRSCCCCWRLSPIKICIFIARTNLGRDILWYMYLSKDCAENSNQHLENLQFSEVDNTYCISNLNTCVLFIECKLVLHYWTLQMQNSIKRRLLIYLKVLVEGILCYVPSYPKCNVIHELNNFRIWHCYL